MANAKHVFQIELEGEVTPQQAAELSVLRLKEDGRNAKIEKNGALPVLLIEGVKYRLSMASAQGSGIGIACAVLREM